LEFIADEVSCRHRDKSCPERVFNKSKTAEGANARQTLRHMNGRLSRSLESGSATALPTEGEQFAYSLRLRGLDLSG
jgi:hypothetical protein